jgi:lactate permease
MFTQIVNPTGNLLLTWIIALFPVVALLILLAVARLSAWVATLIGSILTFLLGLYVWRMPLGDGIRAYLYGSATGVWNVDWITFWGVMLFNTLVVTGVFERFRRWLLVQGTQDVRVQAILFAWAFGALLEGLVGFGYPWAVVAPILITLGIPDLDALRVAAIANNAPVSYGALGAPIIALSAVTGLPLLALSGSIGHIVAILALLPPWILIYLVSGKAGLRDGWPLAIVGSVGYIAGQFPVAVYLGPYLPDIAGAIVSFVLLLLLLRFGARPRFSAMAAPRFRPWKSPAAMLPRTDSRAGRCFRRGCRSRFLWSSSCCGPARGHLYRGSASSRRKSRPCLRSARASRSPRCSTSPPSSAGPRSLLPG